MSDLQEFKCPSCGGQIHFDAQSGKMKCPYCGTELDIDSMKQYQQDLSENIDEEISWTSKPSQQWGDEADSLKSYVCKSCGGEIITDSTTGATSCPYCGSPVVLNSKFSGNLKPDYVIPFKLTKKDAKEKYLEHLKGKPLVPSTFKSENHLDEIKGIYVPFWLYDADVDAFSRFRGTKVSSWSDRDYNYTKTDYYSITRSGAMSFDNVPVDGSSKVDATLMESIEPFNMSEAVDFQTAYLAGYLADKYDIDEVQSQSSADMRIKNSSAAQLEATVFGYSSLMCEGTYIKLKNGYVKYCLLPVWLLNTTYKGKKYTFAMNGQTGKFVGDLPVDSGEYWKRFFIVFVIVAIIAAVITFFVGR